MSKVYGVWYGGASYGVGDRHDDLESFTSIRAAKDALADRERSNGQRHVHFEFVNKPPEDVIVPVVGTDSELWLWVETHADQFGPAGDVSVPEYPGFVVRFGPRGGVHAEMA